MVSVSIAERHDGENGTRTEILAGVLGGITFVFVAVIIIASLYFKRRAQTSSLYKSNVTSRQVALEKLHKKSCRYHQEGYTFDPSTNLSLLGKFSLFRKQKHAFRAFLVVCSGILTRQETATSDLIVFI